MESLWLVKNGVPFDLAFALDEITRSAYCIVFGRFDGGAFNWDSFSWEKPG